LYAKAAGLDFHAWLRFHRFFAWLDPAHEIVTDARDKQLTNP